MQRQRGELVPIGEVVADLGGPVQAPPRNPTTGAAGLQLSIKIGAVILDKPCLIVASTHRRVGLDRS